MTTIALTPEGEAFLARVRDELADLPAEERDELLEDIESHLAEVAGEGGVPLAVRLGSAEDFAQELRQSAGLPPRTVLDPPSRLAAARATLDDALRRFASQRKQLDAALAWRLARGWLLAVAVAIVIGQIGNSSAWGHAHAWLPHPGLRGYGALLALAALVAFSLWLGGRATAGRSVAFDRAATAIALVAIAPAAWHMDSPARAPVYSSAPFTTSVEYRSPPGLVFNGTEVRNIFPFDRSGKPLNDVLLYLPNGHALNVDSYRVDQHRRYLVTRRGNRVYNSFPARYYEPGTMRVAHPNAGPPVRIPVILTPSLDSQAP